MSKEISRNGTGERGTWIYREGKLVPKEEAAPLEVDAPFVWKDEVDAFENPVTGQMESSMSTYRKRLKERGYFEKGNDRMQFKLPSRESRMSEVREDVLEAQRQIKWGMAKSSSGEREIWEQQNRQKKRRAS